MRPECTTNVFQYMYDDEEEQTVPGLLCWVECDCENLDEDCEACEGSGRVRRLV